VSFSVSIMAHPDREARVRTLAADFLGRPGPVDTDVIPVAWDDEGPPARDHDRVWRVARTAWRLHDPRADWHLLLQDDAILSPGFAQVLPELLGRLAGGRRVLSLYLGSTRPVPGIWHTLAQRADQAGAVWIVGPMVMWGVALAVPVPLIADMIAHGDTQRGIPDDMRVGRWGKSRKLEAWHPWPSLVDHPADGSLTGHGRGRTARRFAADGGAGIDWSGGGVIRYGG
jgi:hypothetical protein